MAEIIVPLCTIPGSPEYVKSTSSCAKNYGRFVEEDARPFVRFCRELLDCDPPAWETYFDDEPKTWDRLCREVIGYGPDFIERIMDGVAILEAAGHAGPISAKTAEEYANRDGKNPLWRQGRPSKGDGKVDNINLSGGTQASYLTRRLARDHPDILERMKAGEFRSVRQAALEAGIVKPSFQCPIEPQRAARLILKHFSEGQVRQILEALEQERTDSD